MLDKLNGAENGKATPEVTASSEKNGEGGARRPMSLDDLYRFRRVADAGLSPDGSLVAYQVTDIDVAKNESKTAIFIAPTDGNSQPRAITNSLKKDMHPRFSPDGKSILFQSTRSGSMQLWVIDIGGGEARQLTNICTEASNAIWSTDGSKIAFVSAVYPEYSEMAYAESEAANKKMLDAISQRKSTARTFTRLFYRHWDSYVEDRRQHLFVLPVKRTEQGIEATGLPHDVTPGDRDAYPTSSTFSSGEDFCFSQDGSHLIFTAVPSKGESWNTNYDICRVTIDNQSKDWESLTAKNLAADSGPRLSPDGKNLAWRTQKIAGSEADRWQITIAPVSPDGQLSGPGQTIESKEFDVSAGEFAWTGADSLVFNADYAGAQGIWSVAIPSSRMVGGPLLVSKSMIKKLAVSIGIYSSLQSFQGKLAYVGATMSQPPEVFVVDLVGNKGEIRSENVSNANTSLLAQLDMPRPESVESISIEGDRKMQMWILKPPGFDPKKRYPAVYLVHGGPQGAWEDGWSFRWCPEIWAAQGYVVAMPNPRGSTGFGQKFVEEISGDWGGKCYRDLMAGADYVAKLEYVDADRIASAGASFGGYMMNWFAVNTDRFSCLITHCSVWNFESMWGTTDELWFDEFEHGGLPWEKPEKYREFSPHTKAAALGRFKTPMLVIHNDLDFRCPIGQGHELFQALQRQGVESRFVNFPDEGHWVLKPANSKLWHEEVFDWLKKHNK